MYAKVIAGSLVKYPYTIAELRADHPNTSFPVAPDVERLSEFGIVRVTGAAKPIMNPAIQVLDEGVPANIAGVWTQQWIVRSATQYEMDAYAAQQAKQAQAAEDALADADAKAEPIITYLVNHSAADIKSRINADVTDLASARLMLSRFGVALGALARRQLR